MVTDERCREYTEVCSAVVEWASERPDIKGVAVVGSWARSEAGMRSDIDLVILTTEKSPYVGSEAGLPQRRAGRGASQNSRVGSTDRAPDQSGIWVGD